jgi:hypothetical protein
LPKKREERGGCQTPDQGTDGDRVHDEPDRIEERIEEEYRERAELNRVQGQSFVFIQSMVAPFINQGPTHDSRLTEPL